MSRLLLTTMLWLLSLCFCAAQGARLFNQIVASTGHVSVQQGLTYTYTVGEPVMATLTNATGDITVTQGFHQPEQTRIVSVQDPGLIDWGIEVFPNPTSDRLTIRYSAEKSGNLRVQVFDLLGNLILEPSAITEPSGSHLDCSSWQPGVYFLHLTDPQSQASATVRIVRL